jgi:ABC-2 type transport system ATP-binding protein
VPEPTITCDSLTKRFGELVAVDSVSFEIPRGEIFGLLGPNGAGKSTAIACLLGGLRPSEGSCQIFGFDCWGERVEAHRKLGALPSDFAFESALSGRQVIALFARLRGIPFPTARVDELAERLHADLDRPQQQLSRGNRQKIGLIQALAHDPEVVLMDEPTSGLDPLIQAEFLAIIAELRESGRSVLLSSHNLEEVERSCDRVAMIRNGRLFEIESVERLLARAPKHVRIRFDGEMPAKERLSALTGNAEVELVGDQLQLQVAGPIDPLIKQLADFTVADIEIARPSLDDTFVALYEGRSAS